MMEDDSLFEQSIQVKRVILRLKQLVLETGLDIGSVLIYEAGWQKHITNETAFLAFLVQR
jgi:hypothetical protein